MFWLGFRRICNSSKHILYIVLTQRKLFLTIIRTAILRAATNNYYSINCLILLIIIMIILISHSQRWCIHIACYIWPSVQKPKYNQFTIKYDIKSIKSSKVRSLNRGICYTLLLEKLLKWLINYQNGCHLIFCCSMIQLIVAALVY